MIAVWASSGVARPVAVAVDSLAAHAVAARTAAGALAVVGGGGWCAAAGAALRSGARAILVLHPAGGSAAELNELHAAAGGVAFMVERRRRPSQLTEQVRDLLTAPGTGDAPASLIEIDVSAPEAELTDALTDALAWADVIGRTSHLTLEGHAPTRHGAIARLTARTGVGGDTRPTSVVVTATAIRAGAGALRVTLLASVRVEVEIDLDAGTQRVTVTDQRGATTLAPPFEDPLRHGLRQAIRRLGGAEPTDDLEALIRDRASAGGILNPRSRHKSV
ncbi:hypothetical protein FBY40_0822 [Microbacterium sp. SLBN-154]|uniref:hypothetical protein n=1 Tax=Microbacterium sp. SLBN-154 TaxID=2768458 RepID=UPI00114E9E6E|nr:hypothetical protein [Microbacterium sp. SLBN-154]TQK18335.1 hypothetical protein FBY40_0822 [Microbacterium sp. SLBN-154]